MHHAETVRTVGVLVADILLLLRLNMQVDNNYSNNCNEMMYRREKKGKKKGGTSFFSDLNSGKTLSLYRSQINTTLYADPSTRQIRIIKKTSIFDSRVAYMKEGIHPFQATVYCRL